MPDTPFELHAFLPYRLNQLSERVSRSLAQRYSREFGLSVAEWRLLAILAAHPALQARQIAQQANLDKVRVSRAVARLQQRGLVHGQRNIQDQRAVDLSLSTAGRALFAELAPRALAWEAQLLSGLKPTEQRTLSRALDLLEKRLDGLEQHPEPA